MPSKDTMNAEGKNVEKEDSPPGNPDSTGDRPTWTMVAGFCCIGTLILFMMGLVIASVFGREVPCSSRFLVVALFAAVGGAGAGFTGGWAIAKGRIPFIKDSPLLFGAGGGVGVMLILMFVGNHFFVCEGDDDPSIEIFSAYSAASAPGQENLHVTFRVYIAPARSVLVSEYFPDGDSNEAVRSRFTDLNNGSLVMAVPPPTTGKRAVVRLALLDTKGRELARTRSISVERSKAEGKEEKQ